LIEAVKWFRRAAELRNEEAQLSLGLAYRDGRGVARDYVAAYRWLDLAACNGNAKAISARHDLAVHMSPEQLSHAGASPRCHLTRFDRKIIDEHQQRYGMSCIPSSVEIVLKLLGRVPASYYDLQNIWKNKADGSFHDFDEKTIEGLTFKQQFTQAHSEQFPLTDLFETIDRELKAGRGEAHPDLQPAHLALRTLLRLGQPRSVRWQTPY
jgi:TPR repeat protein